MKARAVARYVRVSPRKARQLADLVRGERVEDAINILHFSSKGAARPVEKVIRSAAANAVSHSSEKTRVKPEDLIVKTIYVDQGITLKRFRISARSMANRIRKRTSHITVVVGESD